MTELVAFGERTPTEIPPTFQNRAKLVQESLEDMEPVEAFSLLREELAVSAAYTRGSMLYTCFIVGQQKQVWDKMGLDEQHKVAESFYIYVGRELGIEAAATTIDNYINTAKVWLIEDTHVDIPEKLFLFTIKDGKATFVVDEDENAYDVPVTVWDCQYSKLLISNARAARDQMEEEDWGLLFNPEISQEKLLSYWRGPRPEPKPGLSFVQVGDWLAVSDGEDMAQIAELDMLEIENNPLARQGWNRLRAVLQMRSDEEEDF